MQRRGRTRCPPIRFELGFNVGANAQVVLPLWLHNAWLLCTRIFCFESRDGLQSGQMIVQ